MFASRAVALLATLFLVSCAQPDNKPRVDTSATFRTPDSDRVLVVINNSSVESRDVGDYYVRKRGIPSENICQITVPTSENVPLEIFNDGIRTPIKQAIRRCKNRIDFIVLTKGCPLRVKDNNGYSVDSLLVGMNLNGEPLPNDVKELSQEKIKRSINPYFRSGSRFSSEKYGIYLVTRLDGYSSGDAKALVDRSVQAKPEKGPFFFDKAMNRNGDGYKDRQNELENAHRVLSGKGFSSSINEAEAFVAPGEALAGYASWGSNDSKFSKETYRKLKFKPGAIAETFVSTSARTLLNPEASGQSLVGDLIRQGVTGVKGYVSEPYLFALASPDYMFDRYTAGFTLAESFYCGSLVIRWKDVVFGDPICAPYAEQKK